MECHRTEGEQGWWQTKEVLVMPEMEKKPSQGLIGKEGMIHPGRNETFHSWCYDPPTFFFPPQPPPAAPAAPAVPIPHIAPVAPPVAAPPPPAPAPQPRPPSPMQVDPVDVPLPTPSTASASTPDHPMLPPPGALASPQRSISPRMLEIISQFQQQAITPGYGRNLPP